MGAGVRTEFNFSHFCSFFLLIVPNKSLAFWKKLCHNLRAFQGGRKRNSYNPARPLTITDGYGPWAMGQMANFVKNSL
jgi:hypothetical protein